ncbi:rhomboid family intramembrane serine protease [Azospirillum doebereinerae]|uniref:Rhomboid family intramembrane serine protease n=1 Tax=Azospirillum doebereinerae TaxID=92933 RepID=A0A433JEW5_9PROT|nr:rhomboid family intramembrane serine protease [Azospirillum doebereinerae]MCG5239147.1 rhomboid family intramembrane serine protease [Azospirillum doebereinerae]RUQ75660.1 rhomboid family intramembrane serine protease [Azospirillum doebereinerae]
MALALGEGGKRTAASGAPAYVNRAVVLACVFAFVLQLPPESFAFVPAYFFGTVDLAGPLPTAALWRGLFGHVLIHGDVVHLVTNMAVLWPLGDAMERMLGHGRYALLFVAGTVAGALTEGALAVDRMAPLIGASGAICALMGAALWLRPPARWPLFRWLRLPLLTAAALFAALNIAMVALPPAADSPLAEVGWGAHVGGLLAGVALAALLRRR